ncbi:MAG: DUF554 domain-containing protein [Bacteroidota bacterium]
MTGLGTIINVGAILVGGAIGLAGKRALPERATSAVLQVMGLFTAVIGLRMLWPGQALISALASLVVGGLIGEWLRIEDRLQQWSERILGRFKQAGGSPAEGFLAAGLLFCVGPMAILGSVSDGLSQDYGVLATKAMLDGIASIPLAATLGVGVLLSSVPVLVYQGLMTLGAMYVQPWLRGPVLTDLNTTGGILVLAIGLSIAGIKRFRVANLLPALPVQVILSTLLAVSGRMF